MAQEGAPGRDGFDRPDPALERRREISLFLFLAVVIWPVLAVAVVGGYGFIVWMYQLIAGPPGPPGV
jgi:nitrate reductase NapE